MVIAEINLPGNNNLYLNVIKQKIKTVYKKYKNNLQGITNRYTEDKIIKAIDTICLRGRLVFCPTNGFYGQILRALEYGTENTKSYRILSQAIKEVSKEVGKNELVIKF